MADSIDSIRGEAEALASDMERAASLAADLGTMLQQANERVAAYEEKAEALFGSVVERMTAFGSQVEDKIRRITETATAFDGAIDQADTLMIDSFVEVEKADGLLSTALHALATHCEAFGKTTVEVAQTIDGALQELVHHATETAEALAHDAEVGAHAIDELNGATGEWQGQWKSFIDQVDQTLDHGMHEIETLVDTHVATDLHQLVEEFRHALEDVSSRVLQEPLTALQEELVHAVSEEFTKLADEAIAAIDQHFKEVMRNIIDVRGGGDAEEQVMRELMQQLKPIFDAVESQFYVVEGIASAVGEFI